MKRELALVRAHRLLAGRPVCLLTTHFRGKHNVMTLGWSCPISIEPPLVVLAIHPSRYSHGLLERGLECVLNVPARPLAEYVVRCGTQRGDQIDKTVDEQITVQAGRRVSALWIEPCLAHIECAVIDQVAPGDHSLFTVEIIGAWAEEEAFGDTWKVTGQPEELLPLAHLGGTSFGLVGTQISVL